MGSCYVQTLVNQRSYSQGVGLYHEREQPPLGWSLLKHVPIEERICTCGQPNGEHTMDCDRFTLSGITNTLEANEWKRKETSERMAYQMAAISGQCCGAPGQPTWRELVREVWKGGKLISRTIVGGFWYCPYLPPHFECKCWNRLSHFTADFEKWLEAGAPLHDEEEGNDGDYRSPNEAATAGPIDADAALAGIALGGG